MIHFLCQFLILSLFESEIEALFLRTKDQTTTCSKTVHSTLSHKQRTISRNRAGCNLVPLAEQAFHDRPNNFRQFLGGSCCVPCLYVKLSSTTQQLRFLFRLKQDPILPNFAHAAHFVYARCGTNYMHEKHQFLNRSH